MLTGLLIAGVLLPLIGAVVALRLLLRMRSRTEQLRRAQLFTSLESLQLQNARVQLLARRAAPVVQRAQNAIEMLRSAPATAGVPQMRDSLQTAGGEMSALFTELR